MNDEHKGDGDNDMCVGTCRGRAHPARGHVKLELFTSKGIQSVYRTSTSQSCLLISDNIHQDFDW